MTISPIAHFHSPLTSKFGIPRQSGIADSLHGTIVFTPEYRNADALRGLEGFDFLWILWGFSENIHSAKHATVRPPRLGGNTRIGVFATRSPFRPNNIGLSSVRIADIQIATPDGPVIEVVGADLMDGTPIYDIKPYLPEFDSHPEAKAGFVNSNEWQPLEVKFLPTADISRFTPTDVNTITQLLSQDPRPHYHSSPDRLYGMTYKGYDIRFRVEGGKVIVEKIES
ncbi:MAG: tRNA (N6-threonylcarbamoyladenosine(37)-N6)-methyltransferase TrmO [Prevotellaceae bacterium]|nr:tRNA (N6-threonylcarbamoyladenosine(37)-N6)-methyltransferase TrmO [Prevotellaceae bacterium]MDD5992835.1 tRNA (N6-threonylcarbamoyladenosine(37)-N6)-methyltransferase TrmO [Prevotellaceae bacterium]MDD6009047.1 tRNA (N6-threonylcarbamoyladenosine(37)-N6)-methyltransferase TrmO [Prevotellaceae bacterium]MDD6781201.1 tRNA (N6-threonylcarbamoyladenosine(37)-N6)-methyltransferase TrmO [Prevotellaceae bacterium]